MTHPPGRKTSTMRRIADSCLPASQNSVKREQTRSNEPGPSVQRICKDIVLAHLEIRKLELVQVGDIDVCGHDLAPSPTCAASQTAMDPRPAPTSRHRQPGRAISRLRRESGSKMRSNRLQPIVFGLLATLGVESVTRSEIRSLGDPGFGHGAII
jgi:hypothetical protein